MRTVLALTLAATAALAVPAQAGGIILDLPYLTFPPEDGQVATTTPAPQPTVSTRG